MMLKALSKPLSTTLAMQMFQVMRTGSAVLTGVVLAKSTLSTAEIGQWETLLYVGTTLTFFWVNGLLQSVAGMYAQESEVRRPAVVYNSFVVFCIIALLLFLLLAAGSPEVLRLITGVREVPFLEWYALFLLFNLPSYPLEYVYLLRQQPRAIVWWGAFSFGFYLLALGVPVLWGHGLETGIMALSALALVKFVWTLREISGFRLRAPDWPLIRRYTRFAMPLVLSSVVSNLMLIFDNWLVNWHYGDPAVFAVYRYGARELPLVPALLFALGASLIPVIAENQARGLAELKRRTTGMMHVLFPVTALAMLTSDWWFPLVFNQNFRESAVLFNIYLLTLCSRMLLPASIILSKGDSGSVFRVSLVELAVKFALGLTFINLFGLPGLAFSVVISFWTEKIGLIWLLERKHGIRTADWVDWRWYLGYSAGLVGLFVYLFVW